VRLARVFGLENGLEIFGDHVGGLRLVPRV
jgi:hypothetical protein